MELDEHAAECKFGSCLMPDNNNAYFWQLVYLVICYAIICNNVKELTSLGLIMFLTPIIIDLAAFNSRSALVRGLRNVLLILNVSLTVLAFFGLAGILFVDSGTSYVGNKTAVYFANVSIPKERIIRSMIIDLSIPIMLYCGRPCKKIEEKRMDCKKCLQDVHNNNVKEVGKL